MIKLKKMMVGWQQRLTKGQMEGLSRRHFELISEELKSVLTGIFGYYALLYSNIAKELVGDQVIVRNSIVISNRQQCGDLICQYEELPIASDCIDLVVLPGILQQSQFPHQILREIERVLIPEGYIVLLIANPISWLSIKNRIVAFLSSQKEKPKLYGRLRIGDWFRLLGLEITAEIPICASSQNIQDKGHQSWIKKMARIGCEYFASYYIIVAKKKVSTLIPIRHSWRSNRKLVSPRLNEPSVNNRVEDCVKQIMR